MGSMQAALKPITHKCFGDAAVDVKSKVNIAKSLLLSRGLFSASTWAGLTAAESKLVHSRVMSVYRSATATHYKEVNLAVSDQELITRFVLMAPTTLIRLARITLLIRMLQHANQYFLKCVFAARRANRSWFATVAVDLAWLHVVDSLQDKPSFGSSASWGVNEWCVQFLLNPKVAKQKGEIGL